MAKFFIFHGVYGYPEENWFGWMRRELENLGHEVFVPHFPCDEGFSLDDWRRVLDDYLEYLDEDSILIAHSMGVAFALDLLERRKVARSYFVAGFSEIVGNSYDPVMVSFHDRSFNWAKIRANCEEFVVFHGSNDEIVPVEIGKRLAEKLGVEANIVRNAGHFNKSAGYDKFPLLLERIKKDLE